MGSSSDGDESVFADESHRSPQRVRRRRGGKDKEEKPASPPKEQATRSASPIVGAAAARGPKKLVLDLFSRALTAALLALAATALLSSSSSSSPPSSSGVVVDVGSRSNSSSSPASSSLFEPTFDSATGLTLPPPSIWDGKVKEASSSSSSPPRIKPNKIRSSRDYYTSLREEAREWFTSTFDLYIEHAFPRDDLKPLSCSGSDSQGGIALTRIDAMTTALLLGEVERLEGTVAWASRRGATEKKSGSSSEDAGGDGDSDSGDVLRFDNKRGSRVHVFELTIRAVGSLVSSHIYLKRGLLLKNASSSNSSSSSSPPPSLRFPSYDGVSLLSQALDLAERLLPAFDTPTGIPLSWVHLTEEGQQPPFWTPQKEKDRSTCAACAGTLLLEFAALSRESGDPRFELAASRAARALHSRRSPLTGLVGNTIDVDTGSFLRRDSGVGAGIDSYYEYLLKSYLLTGEIEWLTAFVEAYTSAMRHCSPPIVLMLEREREEGDKEEKRKNNKAKFTLRPRRKAWRVDSHIDTAAMTSPWISSLGAFLPGLQALAGQTLDASRSHADWSAAFARFGGLPEALDVSGVARHPTLHGYPLRPELVESSFALFAETRHEAYLATGAAVMRTLRERCKARCGFAALADVGDGGTSFSSSIFSSSSSVATAKTAAATVQQQDAMESFFLSETVKYLWLLFSADDDAEEGGSTARLLDGVVLTTEGHPLPPYPSSSPEAEEEKEEEEEESSSSSSSPAAPASCSRLCPSSISSLSSSEPPISSLAISRSLSAAMPLLSPTEHDVETLRRRRCSACRAVETAMAPVREHWAQEMRGAEKAAALAMEKAAERAAAETDTETKKSGGGGGGSPSRARSSSLENLLQRQQQQQLQEQRQLLQQLQFLQQQQQQQQRPLVAQVLCRLQEVVSASPLLSSPSSSSSPSSTAAPPKKSIACGSLSLVPREQMPIRRELVPAETLVLQVVQAEGGAAAAALAAAAEKEEAAAAAAAAAPGEETCPADADSENSSLPPREWRLSLRVSSSSSSSIPPLSLSGYSAEFGPSFASAAACKKRGEGEEETVGGRPCSVSGLVVAARPADACPSSDSSSPPLTFEPAIPAGSKDVVVVVERGNCDFEAKVSAVARALPSSFSSGEAAAVAVVVLSGDDAHLSMGRRSLLLLSPSSSSSDSDDDEQDPAREEGEEEEEEEEEGEPPIPSVLLPRSQTEKLRSAMERAGRRSRKEEEKSEGEEVGGVPLLRAELRAMMPEEEGGGGGGFVLGGSGGSGPPPPLEFDGGSSGAPLLPNLGTVSISALAPASAAAWLNERDDGSGGSETTTSGSSSSSSFVSGGTPLLQHLLASVAQSREFAALLEEVAREKEKDK